MAFQIFIVLTDDDSELVTELRNPAEAFSFALKLADETGRQVLGNGRSPPLKVDVYRNDELEISIRIIRGGLVSGEPARNRPCV